MVIRIIALAVALFLVAPILIVIPMSFSTAISFEFPPPSYWLGYYKVYFSDPAWLIPTANSFFIALATTALTLALVIPASFTYIRQDFVGRKALNLLIMSPLIVPGVVTALGYYGYLSVLKLTGTHLGIIFSHTALAIPVTFLVITAALKGFDRNLERASMISGAGPIRTFFHITLPVLRPGMLVGALFAFLSSFNEAVVALFIGGRDAVTLPRKMYESIRLESDPVIAVVSALLTMGMLTGIVVWLFLNKRSTYAT